MNDIVMQQKLKSKGVNILMIKVKEEYYVTWCNIYANPIQLVADDKDSIFLITRNNYKTYCRSGGTYPFISSYNVALNRFRQMINLVKHSEIQFDEN
jgi:hypothetical protein